jgi:hypothetical protein
VLEGSTPGDLDYDEAQEELEESARRWQKKESRWTVGFHLEQKGTEMGGRLDICRRNKEDRCNSLVLVPGEDLPFPWNGSHVGMGVDALDLVAFTKKRRVVVGRENLLLVLTLDPSPARVESWSVWEDVNTFVDIERIRDLSSHLAHLSGTAYTIDGNRYLYGRGGEVWLGTFDQSLPGVRLTTIPGKVLAVSWSPAQDRVAILDAARRLFMADVTAPGPPLIVLDADEIM